MIENQIVGIRPLGGLQSEVTVHKSSVLSTVFGLNSWSITVMTLKYTWWWGFCCRILGSTPSLPLLPGTLLSGVAVAVRFRSMNQIHLFENYSYLIGILDSKSPWIICIKNNYLVPQSYVDLSRGWPEGSLFNSYHITVYVGATPSPGLLLFILDPYLIMLSVKQGSIKNFFFFFFFFFFLSLWYDPTYDWNPAPGPSANTLHIRPMAR